MLGTKPYEKFPGWTLSKPEGNWSSFQLANSTPPQSVIDSAIAPFARMHTDEVRVLVSDAAVCRPARYKNYTFPPEERKDCAVGIRIPPKIVYSH